MNKILGLDIGTNSIGWALINWDSETFKGNIIDAGSRIIPTDSELLSNYETGQAASKNATRRQARGARRLKQRFKIRRHRLIIAIKELGWIPQDFTPGHQLPVSNERLNGMREWFGHNSIPHDWAIYYIRHKALSEKIELPELACILYHFNQRRGFKSNRKTPQESITNQTNEEEDIKKRREKTVERVKVNIIEEGEKQKGKNLYVITLDDGRKGTVLRNTRPAWENQELELEITKIVSKSNEVRYEFRQLSNTDKDKWAKMKLARELSIRKFQHEIDSRGHIASYYLYELKQDSNFIIKDVPIDRSFYENELRAILEKQFEIYKEHNKIDLAHSAAIKSIAEKLYPGKNEAKKSEIINNNLIHLFLNDIIYYQRSLKSKKSSISECRFEKKNVQLKDEKGRIFSPGYKVAPISSPVFQEFRIWQNVNNIRIFQRDYYDERGRLQTDKDVSNSYLTDDVKEKLFELFDQKDKVNQKQILDCIAKTKGTKLPVDKYLVNLFRLSEDKELPGNETKIILRRILNRAGIEEATTNEWLQNRDTHNKLWHILYSLEDEKYVANALTRQFGLDTEKATIISKAPALKQQYGSLSQKAMKKLLPLMRCGKYWQQQQISSNTQSRLEKIFNGEFDKGISNQVRDLFAKNNITDQSQCKGFMVAMAAYAVYGVHSEKDKPVYDKPEDIQRLKQNELRSPVVEQIVNETLMLVKDIWKIHGRPFEIHLELARDLKKNAKEREEISQIIGQNEKENQRITALIRELKLGGNPESLGDIEKMKLTEKQSVKVTDKDAWEAYKEAVKFKKPAEPTKSEIEKYRLWAQQNFRSPYSGNLIPLNGVDGLFSKHYQVDHIIPRSRFFDDSSENKVVVESYLNKEKDQRTAMQYMLSPTRYKDRFSVEAFQKHASDFFKGKKKRLLLSEDVPESMTNRQLNETRYISRKLNEMLAPVAENQKDPVIATSGTITSELRHSWGLTEQMKELVKWRFERLEKQTGEKMWWHEPVLNEDGQPTGERRLVLKGYSKRIDHRHHALDALIIACTTRSHIKYLNDLNATHYRAKPETGEKANEYKKLLEEKKGDYLASRKFRLPWKYFVNDAVNAIKSIVVSYKPFLKNNHHLFGHKTNRITKYILKNGVWIKRAVKTESRSPYVRVPLGAGTNYGTIMLRNYKELKLKDAIKQPELIADKNIREKIISLINKHNQNWKKIEEHFRNNPLIDKNNKTINSTDKIFVISKQKFTTTIHQALKYPGLVLNVHQREQLKKALQKFSGNRKLASQWLETNPVLDELGNEIIKFEMDFLDEMAANRVEIGPKCSKKWIEENVVNGAIKKAMLKHLETYSRTDEENGTLSGPEVAFDAEGVEALNKSRKIPIRKVRVFEPIGNKYELGNSLAQTAKGTNLFFVIYINKETGERLITEHPTIPLQQVLEARKNSQNCIEEKVGYNWFTLSPGDLVYMPDEEEDWSKIDWEQDKHKYSNKIYKVSECSGKRIFFIPHTFSKPKTAKDYNKNEKDYNYYEFGSYKENSPNEIHSGSRERKIHDHCIKLTFNRLGHVKPAESVNEKLNKIKT